MQHKKRKQFVNFCDQSSFCGRLSSKPSFNLRGCATSLIKRLKWKLSCSSKLSTVRCHRRRWSGGVVGSVRVPEDRHTLPKAHSPVVWKTLRWWCFIVLRGGDYDDDVGGVDVAGNVSVVVDCQPDPCPSGCRGLGGTCWTPPLGATRSQAPPVRIWSWKSNHNAISFYPL